MAVMSELESSTTASSKFTVAAILPVLNEASRLGDYLADLYHAHRFDEVIVVDGGSTDASVEIVCRFMSSGQSPVPGLIQTLRGRARQMRAGADAAEADILVFLHADTTLPFEAVPRIRESIYRGCVWGRFDLKLSGGHFLFRIIERMINWRSALSGIATGDQAMFVRRDVYRLLGGFSLMPLMEDIELSRRLKEIGKPARLHPPVVTSSRRWENHGILRTVVLMWTLRFSYWLGVSPQRLARWYDRKS